MRFSASCCCSLPLLLVLAGIVNYCAAVTVRRTDRTCNDATFSCDLEGESPSPTTEWILNGTSQHRCLANSNKANQWIRMEVTPDCEGFLQCSVQPGVYSAPAFVYAYPKLTTISLSHQSITVGSNITIQCDVIPAALLSFNIRWYHNNIQMTGESAYVLQLVNVSIEDSGYYNCSARHAISTSNGGLAPKPNCSIIHGRSMLINIIESLQLLQELEFVRNVDGTYNFTVLATGTNVTYRWFVDDVLVNISTMPLLRQDFKPGNASKITVEISDELSQLISQTVCVYVPPNNLQFIGMAAGLGFLFLIILLLLIIIAVVVTGISRTNSSHQKSKQSEEQRPSKQQKPSGKDATVILQAFADAPNTRHTHDQLPRFFIECIMSVLERAKPVLSSEDNISKYRTGTEYTAFHTCVKRMTALAQEMIDLYDKADHERELKLLPVQTDDSGDDDDVLNEREELLKQVGLLKNLLKQDEFCSFTS